MNMGPEPLKMKCVTWDNVVCTWRMSGVHIVLLLKERRRGLNRLFVISECRPALERVITTPCPGLERTQTLNCPCHHLNLTMKYGTEGLGRQPVKREKELSKSCTMKMHNRKRRKRVPTHLLCWESSDPFLDVVWKTERYSASDAETQTLIVAFWLTRWQLL